ncbi:MAG: hypothetical protein RMJ35_06210 [Phycisphaerales bacterium]|nr:hypothetical protein [Phycisphaerales bacterium]
MELACQKSGWTVLLFHGVGGGHSINVSRELHRAVCHHLAKNRSRIWCGTFLEVAMHLRQVTRRPWGN